MDPSQIVPLLVQFAAVPLAIIVAVNYLRHTGTPSAAAPWMAGVVGVASAYLQLVLGLSGDPNDLTAVVRGVVQAGESMVFYDLGKSLRALLFPPPSDRGPSDATTSAQAPSQFDGALRRLDG